MKYHNITKDDMLNGDGLRVVLWVSGCTHHCKNCQNPITWDCDYGLEFDEKAEKEIFDLLDKDYISGITLSGGDPLHENNVIGIFNLVQKIRAKYKDKTIWIYTGYKWEDLMTKFPNDEASLYRQHIICRANVLVDGRFEQDKADIKYHWAGSTNQRVIDIQKTLRNDNKIVLH